VAWWRGWEKSDVIAAASAVCAIAVFAFGIWQYRSSENWKRSEFVAAQIKEFNSDKINHAVLLMMDYDPARVELFPEKANAKRLTENELSDFSRLWHDGCGEAIIETQDVDRNHSPQV
jgi:hypothetical protein